MLPLLQSVKIAIAAELPVLTFGYFGSHLRCENFLVKLRSEFAEDVKKIDGITHSNDEPRWLAGGMVYAILRDTVEWELVAEDMGGDCSLLRECRLFMDAGGSVIGFYPERRRLREQPLRKSCRADEEVVVSSWRTSSRDPDDFT